ncbi:MAG TPA: ATP-dependent zinc metalloprotease FtsH [Phycisphaerales bacterium]|nr:ATP-dependent zinc metalloprotease FtsH [Phycisphaerales bacterium]HMP36941.1 ATP-dependent zinc metalloprotease FtsH [Phycisphaerales bacterium]
MTWAVLLLLIAMVWVVLTGSGSRGIKVNTWEQFLTWATEGYIEPDSIVIEDRRVLGRVKQGTPGVTAAADGPAPIYVEIIPTGENYRDKIADLRGAREANPKLEWRENAGTSPWLTVLLGWLPAILIILIIWLILARSMRGAASGPGGMLGSFGKSRHRISSKDNVSVTFNDVAGVDEAKDEVREIVEFLRSPKKFQRLGGRIPRGVLLVGPPGCGKTLLAKAIAGEADVPFFSISGSDFVEMFVGVGASRVRDLFRQAKENSPCIIFLDEIDAVGRRRGGGFTTGGHDEREQTLNAILVEMDGFEVSDQIIVIAATNRSDVLDPALTRPGRFDRQVTVALPDLVGRRQILDVHARKVKMGPDVDLERLAKGTPMFSGADLAAVINEAAIIATLAGKEAIEMADLEEARDKIRFGRAQKSRRIEEQERIATAYHEAGHAVVQAMLGDADPLHKVTIIPRGQALGATFSLPEKDRYGYGRRWLLATMRVLCGGRIAEERKTGDISSGAAQDIRMATACARRMVLEWGMSDRLGFVNYAGEDTREQFVPEKDYSQETAKVIDEEIRQLIDAAYDEANRLIAANWEKVVAVAEALLKFETLQREDVERLMRGERLDKPTIAELLGAELARPAGRPPRPTTPAADDEPGPGVLPSPA